MKVWRPYLYLVATDAVLANSSAHGPGRGVVRGMCDCGPSMFRVWHWLGGFHYRHFQMIPDKIGLTPPRLLLSHKHDSDSPNPHAGWSPLYIGPYVYYTPTTTRGIIYLDAAPWHPHGLHRPIYPAPLPVPRPPAAPPPRGQGPGMHERSAAGSARTAPH